MFLVLLHNVGFYNCSITKQTYKFLFIRTNAIQMTKNIRSYSTLIFYHRAVVKQDQHMTHLLSYANSVL
jgi:hypothetical protein